MTLVACNVASSAILSKRSAALATAWKAAAGSAADRAEVPPADLMGRTDVAARRLLKSAIRKRPPVVCLAVALAHIAIELIDRLPANRTLGLIVVEAERVGRVMLAASDSVRDMIGARCTPTGSLRWRSRLCRPWFLMTRRHAGCSRPESTPAWRLRDLARHNARSVPTRS
jgi:hypothetical protein